MDMEVWTAPTSSEITCIRSFLRTNSILIDKIVFQTKWTRQFGLDFKSAKRLSSINPTQVSSIDQDPVELSLSFTEKSATFRMLETVEQSSAQNVEKLSNNYPSIIKLAMTMNKSALSKMEVESISTFFFYFRTKLRNANPNVKISYEGEEHLFILGPHRAFPGRLSVTRTFGDIEAKLAEFGGNAKAIVCTP